MAQTRPSVNHSETIIVEQKREKKRNKQIIKIKQQDRYILIAILINKFFFIFYFLKFSLFQ